ncbi:MAG: YihY/virulence factor BrkB family protein [Oscillospiraceae bacterium]|nr:YihY/virulence factor BrkB family protein [Oscillospiraceae bacterium]
MKRIWALIRRFAVLYDEKRLSRAAAALSFFLTSTLFPLLIILYTLLGSSLRLDAVVEFAGRLMAEDSVETIEEFLRYVAANNSRSMMMAAFVLLLTSASAAMRTLQATITELQGAARYRGLKNFLYSLIVSLLLVLVLYFAILVMLTGKSFFIWINRFLPVVDFARVWQALRYPLLGAMQFAMIGGLYSVSRPRGDRYPIAWGAFLATLALVGVSVAYSAVIGVSTRYPLVYGSLASIILLMMWLYTCCIVIFSGAAWNIALRDQRREKRQTRFAPPQDTE